MTPQCRELNLAFKVSEQAVTNRLIKKRARVSNAYWGRVKDDGSFPLNRGTTIKGIRLGRVLVDHTEGWSGVAAATYCSTDMCEQLVPDIIRHGFDDYTYSLAKRVLRTDWLCLNDLAIREIPDEEIAHFEDGINTSARYVWDEFLRSRYNHFCDNKFLFKTSDPTSNREVVCQDALTESAYIFELRPTKAGVDAEIDENFIRVNCDPDDLELIAELSFDQLDIAQERLMYEDEAFFSDEFPVLDTVLAAPVMGRRMMEIENLDINVAQSMDGFQGADLRRKLGTKWVAREVYAGRYDVHAPRFYPDTDYNTDLLPGFGAYSALNPTTWPRFKRVYPYIQADAEIAGKKFIYNDHYRKAPFGISNIFTKRVIEMQHYPDIAGYGTAQKGQRGKSLAYGGNATWINPDWPCNEDREMGFWKLRFGAAIKPWMTEQGYSYFHRINRQLTISNDTCDIPATPADSTDVPYCYADTTQNAESRPVAHHVAHNAGGGWL